MASTRSCILRASLGDCLVAGLHSSQQLSFELGCLFWGAKEGQQKEPAMNLSRPFKKWLTTKPRVFGNILPFTEAFSLATRSLWSSSLLVLIDKDFDWVFQPSWSDF